MKREFTLTLDGVAYKIVTEGNTILVNGQPFVVGLDGEKVLVDGTPYDVKTESGQAVVGGITYNLIVEGLAEAPSKGDAGRKAPRGATAAGEGAVTAIMPGKIIRALVKEGSTVAAGDVVCILEAMKMENELKAPRAGVVKILHVQPGQDVERGAVLAEIE
ncbi:MAG: acetyl-CoA carboxylase biotin carboxyl carrier protein subunit [Anaerolineae bacterium]|nr:acetyl-CoA carboxylase biotin carboxyl carrier protein subunit [Anaerolineae bacterium]